MEFAARRAQDWTQSPYDENTQNAARDLLNEGGEALVEAFHTDLEFGTGGLRGLMGVGTNRMNAYTVAQATQGLANYSWRPCRAELPLPSLTTHATTARHLLG